MSINVCQGIFGRKCAKTTVNTSPTPGTRCRDVASTRRSFEKTAGNVLAPIGWTFWSSEMHIKWSRQPLDRNTIFLHVNLRSDDWTSNKTSLIETPNSFRNKHVPNVPIIYTMGLSKWKKKGLKLDRLIIQWFCFANVDLFYSRVAISFRLSRTVVTWHLGSEPQNSCFFSFFRMNYSLNHKTFGVTPMKSLIARYCIHSCKSWTDLDHHFPSGGKEHQHCPSEGVRIAWVSISGVPTSPRFSDGCWLLATIK